MPALGIGPRGWSRGTPENPWTKVDPEGLFQFPASPPTVAPPGFDPRLNALGQRLAAQGGRILAAEQAAPALATGSAIGAGAALQAGYVGSALALGKARLDLALMAAQQSDPALSMGGVIGGPQKSFILPAGTEAGDAGEFFYLRQTDPTAADRKLAEIQNKASAGAPEKGASTQSGGYTDKDFWAAIHSLKEKGVMPLKGQRPIDPQHARTLAEKMGAGQWDESQGNDASWHQPGYFQNEDGTKTIFSGHHRQIAEEMVRSRGIDFTLPNKVEVNQTVPGGNWEELRYESGCRLEPDN